MCHCPQVLLKPIVPETQKEQLEYSLAAERRRVRMLHDDIIKDLLTYGCIQQGRYDKVFDGISVHLLQGLAF